MASSIIRPLQEVLDQVRRQHVLMALKFHQGNRTRTAQALGLSYRGLMAYIANHLRNDPELPAGSHAFGIRRRRVQ